VRASVAKEAIRCNGAPDSPDLWAPDSGRPNQWAPDTLEHLTLGLGVDLFLGAKAAEGASPKTIIWYRMILMRAVAAFGADHPIDRLTGPDLRAWLVELRTTLAPVSVAGYVRTLKVFGNWLQAEQLAEASGLRALRKPRVHDKLIEPVPDDTLRRLLGLASVRDRAILLLLLDTGLRVSEAAGIRLGDLRPDGSVKVMGKGAKERIVPIGTTARGAIVRYLGQRGPGAPDAPLFLGRRGALDWRGMQQVLKRLKYGPVSPAGAARIRCVTHSPGATSSTAAMPSASSESSATPPSTWSSAMCRWRRLRLSAGFTPGHHLRTGCSSAPRCR
jgi:site-specific recombinase XerD